MTGFPSSLNGTMPAAPLAPIVITDTDGTEFRVPARRSARAQRMLLRVDPARGWPELVLPDGVTP